MYRRVNSTFVLLSAVVIFLVSACATESGRPASSAAATVIADLEKRFPPAGRVLKPQQLTADTNGVLINGATPREVYILVHPGYSKFFRDSAKDPLSPAKSVLLELQFDNESRSIRDRLASGHAVILVVPGKYLDDAVAPLSYVAYLNEVAGEGPSVYYVLSETSSTGHLPVNDMVNLYRFLESQHIESVLIGGGYVGRCEREFYNQLTAYIDRKTAFLVPELSTVSPSDLTEEEAADMLASIRKHDYSLVKAMIDKKSRGSANIMSIPDSDAR